MDLIMSLLPAAGILLGGLGLGGVWGGLWQWRINKDNIKAKEKDQERIAKLEMEKQELISNANAVHLESMDKIALIIETKMPNCAKIHGELEAKLMTLADKKIKEAESAHNDIVVCISDIANKIENMKNELTEQMRNKSAEIGIKDKFIRVSNNALRFFSNESIRKFAIYKANAFFDFIMSYRDSIFRDEDSFTNAMNVVSTLYDTVKNEGYNLAGKEFTDLFYEKFHQKSTMDYFSKLKFINTDMVNDKKFRFVDESMSYLQQFLSEMVQAYGVWREMQIDDLRHTHDEELDRKEKI